MRSAGRRNIRWFFLLSLIFVAGCGGGGNSSSGGTVSVTPVFEIKAPSADPPVILGSEQTAITLSVFVSGSNVTLFRVDGNNLIEIGEMTDDGKNGDQTAGDKIYTIQVSVNESVSEQVTFRIKASSNGVEKIRDITIPIAHISSVTTDTQLNQISNDLFLITKETQTLVTSISKDINNASSETIEQISKNLLSMFSKFEAVTNQDVGFELFNLARDTENNGRYHKVPKSWR